MRDYEEEIKTTQEGKVIVFGVFYDLGGMNFFAGAVEARGYYCIVTPEQRTQGMRVTTAFSGTKKLLFAVKRKSPKSLAAAIEEAKKFKTELVEYVRTKNNLTLA